mmetsp:Transcript_8379/g.14893  ORF Transcript_8379/g.14893 Transcript_8379/m.14893 type:complete len:443 (-) Transcript_8379:104-1432(-)
MVTLCLWLVFVVSEGMRGLEVPYLAEAYRLVRIKSSSDEDQVAWKRIAEHSTAVNRILRRFGWKGSDLDLETDDAVADFREALLEAIHIKAQTALEKQALLVRPCLWLARVLHRVRFLRECAILRFRISPHAELSGLGAAASDSAQLSMTMASVMHMLYEMRDEQTAASVPLRMEVDQLSRHVQSQQVTLSRMMRGRGGSGPRSAGVAGLSSVPEAQERQAFAGLTSKSLKQKWGHSLGQSEQSFDLPEPIAMERSLTPEERPLPSRPAEHASSGSQPGLSEHLLPPPLPRSTSASTVSDRSAGGISRRSAGDETPPPTVYGARLSHASGSVPRHGHNVEAFASHLAHLMQAQQGLMSALQASADGQAPGQEHFHAQLLMAMHQQGLINQTGSRPTSGTSRSSRMSRRSRTSRETEMTPFELGPASYAESPSTPASMASPHH